MTEHVFVAWGGNAPTALRVGEELKRNGYFPEVGGMIRGAAPQASTVNANVIEQMERASLAVILVQRIYQGGNPTNDFRPNLMFEWGYLAKRLRNDCIHVYLIDITRKELPTDLAGGYTHQIHLPNGAQPTQQDVDNAASEIVRHFMSDAANIDLDGLEILQRYDHYRARLLEVAKSHSQFSTREIGYTVLHMVQPAFYRNDLTFLSDCLRELATRATTHFMDIIMLVGQIIKYYDATDSLIRDVSSAVPTAPTAYTKIFSDIDSVLNVLGLNRNKIFNIFDVLVDNFRGLTNLRLFELTKDAKYLHSSKGAFESAGSEIQQFRSKHSANETFVRSFWRAYVERNLARVCELLGDSSLAQQYRRSAAHERIRVQALLVPAGVPWLARQFDLEIGLSKFDDAFASVADEATLTGIFDQYVATSSPRGVDRVWDRLHAALLKEASKHGFSNLEAKLRAIISTP